MKHLITKRLGGMLLCLLMCGAAAFAGPFETFDAPDSVLIASHPERMYYEPVRDFTWNDLFCRFSVPTCFGVAYTPNKMESVSFYAKMCLEWRVRKNYGWFMSVGLDSHSCFYKNVEMTDQFTHKPINVTSGEIWYYDLNLGVGYRLPLVKDLAEFYEHPYFNKYNLSFLIQPSATAPHTKRVLVAESAGGEARYQLKDSWNIVPSAKVSLAFEWFVSPKFSLQFEGSYIQHFMPTILERAFYDDKTRAMYPGPLIFNIGFAGFFD